MEYDIHPEENPDDWGEENCQEQLAYVRSQLVESERMAKLGHMTAGIGHEIKNLINFVAASMGPLRMDFADLQKIIEWVHKLKHSENKNQDLNQLFQLTEQLDTPLVLKEIESLFESLEESAHRMQEIVKGLKHFSQADTPQFVEADLHLGLDTTLTLLRHKCGPNIHIQKDYGELPMVECLPGKLNQVFMNILTNAIQALEAQNPPGGEIRISSTTDDDRVNIRISDDGIGMSRSVLEQIFDPFFTTKDLAHGSGLGLHICHKIIKQHHGLIEGQSEPGKGATFEINLPVNQPHSDSP